MKKGFTLIELLAVIVVLAVISLIATPLVLGVIEGAKERSFNVEATNIEQAAEYYLTSGLKTEDIPKYEECYIPVSELIGHIKKLKDYMKNEYVIVKKTDSGISYYYTGRDNDPYLKNKTLKETIESDKSIILEDVKINGFMVNKVIGRKNQKNNIKNWVWYSGQLWQVLETTDEYVKMVTSNSITTIAYGPNNEWETSWVRKWLNEINSNSDQDGIFYHSLSRKDLLLDGRFCLDEPKNVLDEDFTIGGNVRKKVTSFTPLNNCEEISTDKIGLMTFEDYVYSLNGIDAITGALGNSFVDEDNLIWTMTKYTGLEGNITNQVWHTFYNIPSHIEHDYYDVGYPRTVRPVIYMNSKVKIEESNESNYGTILNPYRLINEQKLKYGDSLNGALVGSFVYISEKNNNYTAITEDKIYPNLIYPYDKTKVRYRVIGIDNKGNVKIQRSDILQGLPIPISMDGNYQVPYYHKADTCDYTVNTFLGCANNNYFKPNDGDGDYAYTDGENIGYFLNNQYNGYYTWLDNNVRENIIEADWNLPVVANNRDYVENIFNFNYDGNYPNLTNDGIVSAKIGLPQLGEMFTGNDLEAGYWFINRWQNSSTHIAFISFLGRVISDAASNTLHGVRPVFYLKSSIKITGGEGTPANPYTLSIE